MSEDYTNSKYHPAGEAGSNALDGAIDTSWQRLEPLITPEQLKNRYLFGIPLVSGVKDSSTGLRQIMGEEILKDYILGGVSDAEMETSSCIFPVKFLEKHPFDRCEYESFGYFSTNNRPVYSIDKVSVNPANNSDVFNVALDWIETAYMVMGQINIVPLTAAILGGALVPPSSAGAAVFLGILAQKPWVPSFWEIDYTAGYPDGMVPRYVNDLIGVCAAIRALSQLAATYAHFQSASLGIDGMSQSASTLGPQRYMLRIRELEEEKMRKVKLVKRVCGLSIFATSI